MIIGIYGGTFDPPHIGHINACKQFLNAFNMDKLFVIPSYVPPHKDLKSNSTVQNRFEMTQIAFSGISDKIEISDVEIKRKGKSFTADTLSHFKKLGYDNILFLCGTDMYLTLEEGGRSTQSGIIQDIFLNLLQSFVPEEKLRL